MEDKVKSILKYSGDVVFLVGAGISRSSGVPTGKEMIKILKKRYPKRLSSLGIHSDYPTVLEKAFPKSSARRYFIEQQFVGKRPAWEHRYIAGLLQKQFSKVVITTNFDHLLEEVFPITSRPRPFVYLYDVDTDPYEFLERQPTIVKIHGDFLFNNLANLEKEMKEKITKNMQSRILGHLKNKHLVVVGYSGSDKSVMGILEKAAGINGVLTKGVTWVAHRRPSIRKPLIHDFFKTMRCHNKHVNIIDSIEAEEFLSRLYEELKIEKPILTPFGISERQRVKTPVFPVIVERSLQDPPGCSNKNNQQLVNRVAGSRDESNVIFIRGPALSGKSVLAGQLVREIGYEKAFYFDFTISRSPVSLMLSEQLDRYMEIMEIKYSKESSYLERLVNLFGEGKWVFIDGLDRFLYATKHENNCITMGPDETSKKILTLIQAASIAQKGHLVLVLRDDPKSDDLYQALLTAVLHSNQFPLYLYEHQKLTPSRMPVKQIFFGSSSTNFSRLDIQEGFSICPSKIGDKGISMKISEALGVRSIQIPGDKMWTAEEVNASEYKTSRAPKKGFLIKKKLDKMLSDQENRGVFRLLSRLRYSEIPTMLVKIDREITEELLNRFCQVGLVERRERKYIAAGDHLLSDDELKLNEVSDCKKIADAYLNYGRHTGTIEDFPHSLLEAQHFYFLAGKYKEGLSILLEFEHFFPSDSVLHNLLRDYSFKTPLEVFDPDDLIEMESLFHKTHPVSHTPDEERECDILASRIVDFFEQKYSQKERDIYIKVLKIRDPALRNSDESEERILNDLISTLPSSGYERIRAFAEAQLGLISQNIEDKIEHTSNAADIYKSIGVEKLWLYQLDNLANNLISKQDYKKTIKIEQKALKYHLKYPLISEGKAVAYGNLFISNLYLGRLDLAEGFFYESNLNFMLIGDRSGIFLHLAHLLVKRQKIPSLVPSSFPSSHSIYKVLVHFVPTIWKNSERIMDYVESMFKERFRYCWSNFDRKGCREVTADIDYLKSHFEIDLSYLNENFRKILS